MSQPCRECGGVRGRQTEAGDGVSVVVAAGEDVASSGGGLRTVTRWLCGLAETPPRDDGVGNTGQETAG